MLGCGLQYYFNYTAPEVAVVARGLVMGQEGVAIACLIVTSLSTSEVVAGALGVLLGT